MIKIENTSVEGWAPAIRGMRNPMNSWDKSDTTYNGVETVFKIGPNDLELMQKLCKGGPDDRKFLRMIVVWVDITAPLYWWKEFDTYKVGTVANSCSTMHKLHSRMLNIEDFSCEKLTNSSFSHLMTTIDFINSYRYIYNEWDSIQLLEEAGKYSGVPSIYKVDSKEDAWDQMIQLLPSSYNQKRTVMLNYEVLRNMYHARKNHKLDEWHDFCRWIEEYLPYSYELIFGEDPAQEWKMKNCCAVSIN